MADEENRTTATARRPAADPGQRGDVARRVGVVAFWLCVWQVASLATGNTLLLAGPVETAVALVGLVGRTSFWGTVWFSFAHIAGGFLAAFALALVLAGVAHTHALVRELLQPPMMLFKSAPVVCIVVLLLIWFGSRAVGGISVFLVVFPGIYFSALGALDGLDPAVGEMLELHGVGPVRRALAYVWPGMLPYLSATCRMVVGMSWKAGVAAELIGAPMGSIGERIYQAKLLLETADLFAWTIVIIALAYGCELVFLWILGRSGKVALRLSVSTGVRRDGAGMNGNQAAAPGARSGAARLALDGVEVDFGDRCLVRGLSHEFCAGSRTCLVDPSGAGKTTVLRLLAGLRSPDMGRVVRDGRPGEGAEVSMAFQESRLVEQLSAVDNVVLVAGRDISRDGIRGLLSEVLPGDALDKPVGELSGGMRRRVELVRALAVPSGAVLLDEPFSALDEASHARAAAFVLEHLDGRTLVVATHAPEDVGLLNAVELRLFS